MEQKAPEKLFACFCKRSPLDIESSIKAFSGDAGSSEIDPVRREHLRYAYDLAEKGITWAGGPLGNFQGTLSIYEINTEEEARKARRNDPYYLKGMFYDNRYYEWFIHAPLSLCSPAHKVLVQEGLKKAGLEGITESQNRPESPQRLFVCFSGMAPLTRGTGEIVREHFRYQFGYLMKESLIWAGGPLGNYEACLQIFAVNSIGDAKNIVERDPFSIKGIFYDNQYYEWFIHMPLRKASPAHKEKLRQSLKQVGINPV